MQLDYLANIAEIAGVLLVVVTLVFLAAQIRQQTKALKSSTIQAVMQSEIALTSVLVEHADAWEKVLTGQSFTPGEETRRAIILFNILMTDTESRYHQYKIGFLDLNAWAGRQELLPELVQLPIFEPWRESPGGKTHSTDFLEMIDNFKKGTVDAG